MRTGFATISVLLASAVLAAPSGVGRSAQTSSAIVFAAGHYYDSHIFTVNDDGTGLRILARGQGFDGSPKWSPDKSLIAFVRRIKIGENFRGDAIFRPDVWLMRPDGTRQRLLVRGASDPAWSPDGSTIAYVRNSHIWTVVLNGGQARQLTNGTQEGSPDWSPDGTRLVFEEWLDPMESLGVMNADGSAKRRLIRSVQGAFPAWSPDGRRILFQSYLSGNGLFVVRANGRGVRKLATGVASKDDLTPDWSPDGRLILFEREGGNGVIDDLYVVRPDGSGLRKLARDSHVPTWSPDGRLIAFVRSDHQLHVISADGGAPRRIARSSLISSVDW